VSSPQYLPTSTSPIEPDNVCVVCVHGLYMTGLDMGLLRLRLRRCGFRTRQFSYGSWRRDIARQAARLDRFLRTIDAATVHLVAHSLGGLLVHRMLADFPQQSVGRVVTLGTPHCGSAVAERLQRCALGRLFLGRTVPQGLLAARNPWPPDRELGVVAGTGGIGIGRLVTTLAVPNDGTVTVAETRLPAARDHATVSTSHTGLLYSAAAAREVCHFLHTGRFLASL
jgi:pimeloyl-ACP methyl ester carboxylesterase